jgi:hypothetical protein
MRFVVDQNRNRKPCKIPYSTFHPHPSSTTREAIANLTKWVQKTFHSVEQVRVHKRVDLRLAHLQHVLPGKQSLHWRMSLLQ